MNIKINNDSLGKESENFEELLNVVRYKSKLLTRMKENNLKRFNKIEERF